jgi:hypothetical protein
MQGLVEVIFTGVGFMAMASCNAFYEYQLIHQESVKFSLSPRLPF